MRQIWIPKKGEPEVLEVRAAHDPTPARGEVRIRVGAAGVNFADILARMGLYPDAPPLPTVVGYEVAGEVDVVGPEAEGLGIGDRVLALTRFGGYSDVVTVPALQVTPIPDGLGFEDAASLPVNWLTAWLMLVHLGNLRKGERVLVHAAAGGVGLAATQICLDRGAEVIGAASAAKHDRLRELGVAHCVDYHTEDFETRVREIVGRDGVDIALDAAGGRSFAKSYRCLGPLGRLFVFGVSSFAPGTTRSLLAALKGLWQMPSFKPIDLMDRNRGVFGVNLGHLWGRGELLRSLLGEIVDGVASGRFRPVVDRAFDFDHAADAHRYIQDRKNFGKVVLVP